MQKQKDITFGKFRLDFINECLWQGTRAISLRPKAFSVLKLLIAYPGQLVSKQQVLDSVWPGTFVGDAVLKDNIRQLREALDDAASSPTYIETAHRRGYRFIGQCAETNGIAQKERSVPDLPAKVSFPSSPPISGKVLGREAELCKMQDWFDRSLRGERQTVFVTGEPGIGKTTIINAFLETTSIIPELRVMRGQCLEHYGAGEAYLPVLDGLSRLCRFSSGAQVLDLLGQHAPAWLAQMPSLVPQSQRGELQFQAAGASRERMLREMAELIEALSSTSPLLLVLEDLHWSDYSTLDLVSYLARRSDPAHLMVIGTYRPVDVIVGDHPLKGVKRELQAHSLCQELPLEYLSETSIQDYLVAQFPVHQFPPRLKRTIYQRTEGNPLFMVNLVEYLMDHDIIIEEQGTWKLRVDLSEIEQQVPANLRQLIERQMERLSPDERSVLEAACVAGMECSSVAIAAGLGMPLETVEGHCEELARRHQFLSPAWLVELPDGTITPRHRFIHVLYRDVPYRLIPPRRRAQIHQRIAERGIAIYGDRKTEIAAELAMHFEQSRDWPRAVEYLLQAAEKAVARSAHHEAIDLANRGLEALKFLSEPTHLAKQEMKLRMILTVSLMAIQGFASAEAEKINAHGRELFWRHGPSPELFYMLWTLNLYRQFRGEMNSSLEIAYQLMQLAEDLKDHVLIMQAHRALGAVLVLLGRCREALEHIEKGTALCAAHQNHRDSIFVVLDSEVMFECFAALALLPLGYPDRSAERLAAGLALARDLGHPQTLVVALHIAAQLHHVRGEAPLVLAYAREAMELADEYGLSVWRAYGLMELGWAEAELGDTQVGIERMDWGLREYEATGAKLRSPYFLGLLADQLGKRGRVEEALVAITKALTIAEQTGEGYSLAQLHLIKGELILKTGERSLASKLTRDSCSKTNKVSPASVEARSCFREAMAVAKQQQTRSWELRAAMSMHRLELTLGNSTNTQLAQIYSTFTEGYETADLRQAKILLDAVHS